MVNLQTFIYNTKWIKKKTDVVVKLHLHVGQAQPKNWSYLTPIKINIKLPSFDGGGVCTGERLQRETLPQVRQASHSPKVEETHIHTKLTLNVNTNGKCGKTNDF